MRKSIMIDETITSKTIATQYDVTQPQTDEISAQPKPKQPRQLVRFTFYKLDRQWQLLPAETREQGRQQLLSIFRTYEEHSLIRSFGLYGKRTNCDFMLWQATYQIEDLQGLSSQI